MYSLGKKTASIYENGGSLSQYMWSYVRSMFLLEMPRKFTETDKFDPHAIDNMEVGVASLELAFKHYFRFSPVLNGS